LILTRSERTLCTVSALSNAMKPKFCTPHSHITSLL